MTTSSVSDVFTAIKCTKISLFLIKPITFDCLQLEQL
jgi:hypothetical protein